VYQIEFFTKTNSQRYVTIQCMLLFFYYELFLDSSEAKEYVKKYVEKSILILQIEKIEIVSCCCRFSSNNCKKKTLSNKIGFLHIMKKKLIYMIKSKIIKHAKTWHCNTSKKMYIPCSAKYYCVWATDVHYWFTNKIFNLSV